MSESIVSIPRNEWNSLKRTLAKIEKNLVVNDLISEEEACRLLGRNGKALSFETLKNYIRLEKIPADCYTETVTGSFLFFKTKLMGLK